MPKSHEKDPWLRCETVPGLCLRVRPVKNGWRRELYASYTWHGRTRHRALGLLEEWGLERAADEVRDIRVRVKQAQVRGDADPTRLPAPYARSLATMSDLADTYQQHSTKAESSQKEDARNWSKVLACELQNGEGLGDRGILDVTSADLWTIRKTMEQTPVAFNRTLALLSNAFNLAERYGLVDASESLGWTNPCRNVEKFPERRRERVFSVEEYQAIRLALDRLIQENLESASKSRHARFKARSLLCFRILARTAMRPVEIRTLTKSEVHWGERFADTRKAKGDRGGSRGRILAFGPRALEDLRIMEALSPGSEFFLPSWVDSSRPIQKQGTRKAWAEAKIEADRRFGTSLDTDSEASIYVLRHTVVNRHARAGVDLGDIHDFVGHRSAKAMITHTYRHTDVPRLLEIAQQMEDHLERLVFSESSEAGSAPPADLRD